MDPGDNLVSRAVQGDQEALVALLTRHGPAVRRTLAGRIPPRHQSVLSEDDVMQQTYADAAAHIGGFVGDSERAFAAWLETIASRNRRDAVKMLDAIKRGRGQSITDCIEMITGGRTSPSKCAAGNEAKIALGRAIEQLPADYAQVVRLYVLEERPIQEVAEKLQRSQGAVFMLLARARDRLHEILGSTSNFFSGSS